MKISQQCAPHLLNVNIQSIGYFLQILRLGDNLGAVFAGSILYSGYLHLEDEGHIAD